MRERVAVFALVLLALSQIFCSKAPQALSTESPTAVPTAGRPSEYPTESSTLVYQWETPTAASTEVPALIDVLPQEENIPAEAVGVFASAYVNLLIRQCTQDGLLADDPRDSCEVILSGLQPKYAPYKTFVPVFGLLRYQRGVWFCLDESCSVLVAYCYDSQRFGDAYLKDTGGELQGVLPCE